MSGDGTESSSSDQEDFDNMEISSELQGLQIQQSKGRISPTAFLPDGKVGLDFDEANAAPKTLNSGQEAITTEVDNEAGALQCLLTAAENGDARLVEELLVQYPSLHERSDEDGYRALHRASYEGHLDVVKVLIARGADVRARTLDGWEPLHSACRWGKVEVASLLLQNGGHINAATDGKQTALHLAALGTGGSAALKLLLSNRRLDATLINNQGETAYDIAHRTGKWVSLFEVTEDSINVK